MGSEARSFLLVFTAAKEGREAEFIDWYQDRHIPELLEHPNVLAATQYRIVDDSSGRLGTILTAWEISGDDPATNVQPQLREYAKTPTEAMDRERMTLVVAEELLPRRTPAGAAPAGLAFPQAADSLFLVFNQGHEGQQEQFLTWYGETHMPEVLESTGFLGCTRVRITMDSSGALASGGAIYEIEGSDPLAVIGGLRNRKLTPGTFSDPSKLTRVAAAPLRPRVARG